MNEGLTVPPSASFYILLQRTDNQSVALSRQLRRVPGRTARERLTLLDTELDRYAV